MTLVTLKVAAKLDLIAGSGLSENKYAVTA